MSFLIPAVDLSKFPKHFVRKCLLHRSVHAKRIPPAKSRYEHVFCFGLVEIPWDAKYLAMMATCFTWAFVPSSQELHQQNADSRIFRIGGVNCDAPH